MASITSGFLFGTSSSVIPKRTTAGRIVTQSTVAVPPRRMVVVRAEAINPEKRKTEDKVVDSVVVTELSRPYCRSRRSGTFPLWDESHEKHNKATGDNVGPLFVTLFDGSHEKHNKSTGDKVGLLPVEKQQGRVERYSSKIYNFFKQGWEIIKSTKNNLYGKFMEKK